MSIKQIIENDKKYFMNTFGDRIPVAFVAGDGIYLTSTEGKKYIDFFSGIAVNSLGYNNKALIEAIQTQAAKLIHCSNYYYVENQAELAKKLVESTFADKAFFSNSGAEANEAAFKLARAYFSKQGKSKYKIVSLNSSFHGRTLATVAATGTVAYQKPFAPMPEGFIKTDYNQIHQIEQLLSYDKEICAIIIEPIMGEGGVFEQTNEYLSELRKICDQNDILLIFDEVQTGMGRTGDLFAYQATGVTPDIMTTAKALGGGLPIGACLAIDKVASAFAPGDHGSTYIGGPVTCAAALAVLKEIEDKNLCKNARDMGKYLIDKLNELSKKHTDIIEIRGRGLMLGIQFTSIHATEVKNKMFEKGYLVGVAGGNTLRLLPPLIITAKDVFDFIDVLDEVLSGM